MAAAVEGLDLEEAALWREMGTSPGDFEAEAVAGRSTSEHAAKMVNAAARLTLAVVDLAEDRIGESDASREVRAELDRLAGPLRQQLRAGPPHSASHTRGSLRELTADDMTRPVQSHADTRS